MPKLKSKLSKITSHVLLFFVRNTHLGLFSLYIYIMVFIVIAIITVYYSLHENSPLRIKYLSYRSQKVRGDAREAGWEDE